MANVRVEKTHKVHVCTCEWCECGEQMNKWWVSVFECECVRVEEA